MARAAKSALLGLMVAASLFAVPTGRAQVTARAVQAKPKPVKARFEVMHMLPSFIQVRSMSNATEIHNFTYADAIRGRMQQMLNNGGYQYGDKVTIEYWPDQQVAVKITGKPSKRS